MKFIIISGPNINCLDWEEPGIPGSMDYNGLVEYIHYSCEQMGIDTEFYQSNHEGDLIDEIQSAPGRADGIVINPAGYAHTSVALLDALRCTGLPAAEVLLEAPSEKEPFRMTDIVSFGCTGHFIGEGPLGYLRACAYLAHLIEETENPASPLPM